MSFKNYLYKLLKFACFLFQKDHKCRYANKKVSLQNCCLSASLVEQLNEIEEEGFAFDVDADESKTERKRKRRKQETQRVKNRGKRVKKSKERKKRWEKRAKIMSRERTDVERNKNISVERNVREKREFKYWEWKHRK